MAGFERIGNALSGDYTGRVNTYYIATAGQNYAIGDVVVLGGTSHTDGTPTVVAASQGAAITGVIVGFKPDFSDENFSSIGLASGASGYVSVADDPDGTFEVECDATLAAADVGLNAEAVVTAPTVSGNLYISNMEIDSSTKATTNTLHFRIVKLLNGATSGTLGDRAIVKINNSTSNTGTTGV